MIHKWIVNASPLIALGKAGLIKLISPLAKTWRLLLKAKKEKLTDRVKPAFEKPAESGLYLDPHLIKRILTSVGE